MMRSGAMRVIIGIAASIEVCVWAIAQPPVESPASESEASDPAPRPLVERFKDRLIALRPDDAKAYLLLGEEVADQATTSGDQRLALDLLARAFEAARVLPGAAQIAAGASLALTEIQRTERDKSFLRAMARLIDPVNSEPMWLRKAGPTSADAPPYQIALVLGYVRVGEGSLAKAALAKPEVRQSLLAIEPLLRKSGWGGGVNGLMREAGKWPCPECLNKRVVRRTGAGVGGANAPENKVEYKACPICNGKPGPQLTVNELLSQLRFESVLLQGSQRSWAAQITADDGAPLVDPDPAGLCQRFNVDAARMYWRNGRWVRNADGTDVEAVVEKEPKKATPTVDPKPRNTAGS